MHCLSLIHITLPSTYLHENNMELGCSEARVCVLVIILVRLTVLFTDAVEKLHEFTSSESAWSPAYENMLDADLTRVPHCTEQLMALIKEITGEWVWSSLYIPTLLMLYSSI